MGRGGARPGAGRPRRSPKLRILSGADRPGRDAKAATAGAEGRKVELEAARRDVADTVRRLARIIKGDRTDGWPARLPKILREHRLQLSALVQLSAAVGAIARELRDTPPAEEPNDFDEFLEKATKREPTA